MSVGGLYILVYTNAILDAIHFQTYPNIVHNVVNIVIKKLIPALFQGDNFVKIDIA